MKFLPLALIRIRHSYYADGRCPDFHIEPTDDCARLLRNHRLVTRAQPDGILVITPDSGDNTPFIPFAPDMTLRFHLRAVNPDFALFTDLGALSGLDAPVYGNSGQPAGELTPASGPGSPAAPRAGRNDFAGVEISGVDAAWLENGPAAFHIAFASKQARWAYYFVTDIKPSEGPFHIVDSERDPPAGPLVFSDDNRIELGETPDPLDRQASDLARLYPGLRRIRFVSDQPIPCSQTPRASLELRLGSERLQGPLPNPSPRSYTTLEVEGDGATPPQDTLFQVVKYITHPEPNRRGP